MRFFRIACGMIFLFACFISKSSWANIDGSISGNVTDSQGVAIPGAQVDLVNLEGKTVKKTTTSEPGQEVGKFVFIQVQFGDYRLQVEAPGFSPFSSEVHVTSGGLTTTDVTLVSKEEASKEMVLEVTAKKTVHSSASVSSTELNQKQIQELPQGNETSLPRLITTTMPGVVQGPFGQMFFRGNHANIQYQIDGVQLPDSPSNTFGQALSPRNVDHMEVITGGIPAEYGQRLSAVVNMVTKSGTEVPGGEIQLNYGAPYNTVSPHLLYGGSNDSGSVHYFLSLNYNQTNRGIDTPQPASESNQYQGGTQAIHDQSTGHSEFAKVDWQADNANKVSFIAFNSQSFYQIPNYPSSFSPSDAFFQPGYTDAFGNEGEEEGGTTFRYVPPNTNDTQSEYDTFLQVVWKHTFSERSFLQLAPYYKYSLMVVTNDPENDLASEQYLGEGNSLNSPGATRAGATPIDKSTPTSFAENRHVNNLGLKGDYTLRASDSHLVKSGFQLQGSRADGTISIQTDLATPAYTDSTPNTGLYEAVYLQDDWSITKKLTFNAGLRFDATQYSFGGLNPTDSMLQPRVGMSYFLTDTTKLHLFYGKLFQPAPLENLRTTFNYFEPNPTPYDIKAEKDDYYEAGIAQQFLDKHMAIFNVYYKNAINMLDDAQLLNTPIAQPYNFAQGYAYGAELSLKGQLTEDWSEYANYSYDIAKGQGISGGIWTGVPNNANYQFLDHVQIHTANAGLTYAKNYFWWTTQGLYGSGLRTGENNSVALPGHFTMDTTLGYQFHGKSWFSDFKLSGDVLNIFNNVYPITIANGFNGSHYAAGRQYFIRLTKYL